MEQSKFSTNASEDIDAQYNILGELDQFFVRIGVSSSTTTFSKSSACEHDHFPSFSEFALSKASISDLVQSQRKVDILASDVDLLFSDDDDDDDDDDDGSGDDWDDHENDDDSDGFGGRLADLSDKKKFCKPCDGKRSKKRQDLELREAAINRTKTFRLGNMTCKCAVSCVQKLTVAQVYRAQERFWGKNKEDFPSSKIRSKKMMQILAEGFHKPTKTFKFNLHDPVTHVFETICEAAMTTILFGPLEDSSVCTLTTAPRGWRTLKASILKAYVDNGQIPSTINDFASQSKLWKKLKAENKRNKREKCRQYISSYCKHNCESSVIEPGVKFLPFRSLKCFYEDYVLNLLVEYGNEQLKEHLACERTFGRALTEVNAENTKEKIRFMRSKGSFNSCEVCVTAAELLTKRRFSQTIRELIGTYRGCDKIEF